MNLGFHFNLELIKKFLFASTAYLIIYRVQKFENNLHKVLMFIKANRKINPVKSTYFLHYLVFDGN